MSFTLKSSIVSTELDLSRFKPKAFSAEKSQRYFGAAVNTVTPSFGSSINTSVSLIEKLKLKNEHLLKQEHCLMPQIKKAKVLEDLCEKKKVPVKRPIGGTVKVPVKPKCLKVKKQLIKVPEKKVKKVVEIILPRPAESKVNLDYEYYFERLETRREDVSAFGEMEVDYGRIYGEEGAEMGTAEENLLFCKKQLLDTVSACLLNPFQGHKHFFSPTFTSKAQAVADLDPEFILKLALYSRKHLNIRLVSNCLLAYASTNQKCKSFLVKYFNESVVLPTDWIAVAELSLTLRSQDGGKATLPPALRKVMVTKFEQFDEYQLGKYNKSKKKKKKKKEEKAEEVLEKEDGKKKRKDKKKPGYTKKREAYTRKREMSTKEGESMVEKRDDDVDKGEAQGTPHKHTLKQLIRRLHISKPVQHVMSILGKRYPRSREAFREAKLPGDFDDELAGKRMKLPTPETWETQVSKRGNKEEVWQDLIDHKKLPFMAMLRNIRNMLMAGISDKHHAIIIKRLSDQNSVINSKQFPFSFLNAFSVLEELEKLKSSIAECPREEVGRKKRTLDHKEKAAQRLRSQLYFIDSDLIEKYKKALNAAVEISTRHNITPISGTSLIFLDLTDNQATSSGLSSKNFGSADSVGKISCLLALMCQRGCERGELVVLGKESLVRFKPSDALILDDVKPVLALDEEVNKRAEGTHPSKKEKFKHVSKFFDDLITTKCQVNNVIFLNNSHNQCLLHTLTSSLLKYHHLSNQPLASYHLRITNPPADRLADDEASKYWVEINGCSDQIIRFIAENGDSAQLKFVDNIDKLYNLKNNSHLDRLKLIRRAEATDADPAMPLPKMPKWTTCRVFISSTFLDMFSERDLLVRHVFDELKRRGRELMINVVEVDLRWGITEEDAKKNDTLELCLSEVIKSEFFIGMLGERYGKVMEDYGKVAGREGMQWLEAFPPGASLTHLEFQQCFQSIDFKQKAFFYFRNPAFIKDVPAEHRDKLVDAGDKKLLQLKAQVKSSGAEVFDDYPCSWGGMSEEGQPIIHGLEEFGARVLDNLWNAILQSRQSHMDSVKDTNDDELSSRRSMTTSWLEGLRGRFRGRKRLLEACVAALNQHNTGLLLLTGKPGSGKSSLLASLVSNWSAEFRSHCTRVVVYCVGAYSGSKDVEQMLKYLCVEVKNQQSYAPPGDYKSLCLELLEVLKQQSSLDAGRLLLFIDGVDQLDDKHNAKSLSWLPEQMPKNVLIVVTGDSNSESYVVLKKRVSLVATMEVGDLEISDRMEVVRAVFKGHAKKLEENAFNNQLRTLVQKREASSPLYLSLACEEVRKYGNFEQLSKRLTQLPATLASLVTEVLQGAEAAYGEDFVTVLLCCLHCSRDGLTEDELCHVASTLMQLPPHLLFDDVTSLDIIINTISSSSSASSSFFLLSSTKVLSFLQSIRNLLKPFSLNGHSTDITIRIDNGVLRTVISTKYLVAQKGKKVLRACHLLLAYLFLHEADPADDMTWQTSKQKALSELPYHLLHGHDLTAWYSLMVDWRYVWARFKAGQATMMMQEYALQELSSFTSILKRSFENLTKEKAFLDYKAFVLKNFHTLSTHSQLFLQQALLEDDDSTLKLSLTNPSHPSSSSASQTSIKKPSQKPSIPPLVHPSTNLPFNDYFTWPNKKQFVDHCVHSITSLKQVATCMCFSKDNCLLAVGFDDVIIRLFNTHTYQMEGMLIGHSSDIMDMCFVGSNRLCSASKDCTLSLWNVQEKYRVAVMEKHDRGVSGCVSDHVGRVLVSVGLDCRILLWHGVTGVFEDTLAREKSPINCVAMEAEGRYIVTGLWQGTLNLYDLLQRKRRAVFRGHAHSVTCVAFDQSGEFVTSADLAGEVRTWNVLHGCTVSQFKGHSLPIRHLSFSGHYLLTASHDSLIKVSSAKAGKFVAVIAGEKSEGGYGGEGKEDDAWEHDEGSRVTCLSINPDSSPSSFSLATGYHNGYVKLHSFIPGALLWRRKLSVVPVCISSVCFVAPSVAAAQEGGVLVGRMDGSIYLLDSTTGCIGHQFEGATAKITCIATATVAPASPSSSTTPRSIGNTAIPGSTTTTESTESYAICACEDRLVYVFSLKELLPLNMHCKYQPHARLSGHDGAVSGVCVSPSQLLFASIAYDMRLIVWSLERIGQKVHVVENAHADWLTCCAWTNQGDFLVTGSLDFNLKIWEVRSEGVLERRKLTGHMASLSAVAYKYGCIVSSSTNGELKVWSHKGVLITSLHSHSQRCNDLGLHLELQEDLQAVSSKEVEGMEDGEKSDGGRSGGRKKDDNEEMKRMGVRSMYVVTCSDDASIKLWKPLESEERATLIGHVNGVTSLAVGRDGLVCSGGGEGCLKVWRVAEDVARTARNTVDATAIAVNSVNSIVCIAYNNGGLTLWSEEKTSDGCTDYPSKEFQVSSQAITALAFLHHTTLLASSADKCLFLFALSHTKKDSFSIQTLHTLQTFETITSLSVLSGGGDCGDENNTRSTKRGGLEKADARSAGEAFVVAGASLSGTLVRWKVQAGCIKELDRTSSMPPVRSSVSLAHPACFTHLHFTHNQLLLAGSPLSTALCFFDRDVEHESPFKWMKRLKLEQWACSVAMYKSAVCVAGCDGRVWLFDAQEAKSVVDEGDEFLRPKIVFKAHEKRVLSILVVHNLLFTASEDLLLKVWCMHTNKQLGQFACASAVSGMALLGSTHESYTLVCASKAASTFVLKWNHSLI